MRVAAKELDFEVAAILRDEIKELNKMLEDSKDKSDKFWHGCSAGVYSKNMSEQEKTEFKKAIVQEVVSGVEEKLEKKFESRLQENNGVLLDAVSNMMDKKMQEFGVRQDEFEGRIIGLLQDLHVSNTQTQTISEKVDVQENIIKTNILPRLDILEKVV